MTVEEEVRQAVDRYYEAFNSVLKGDLGLMGDVYSHEPDVIVLPALGGRRTGWDELRGTLEQVAKAFSGGKAWVSDLVIRVIGDLAYTTGIEHSETLVGGEKVIGEIRATHIYRREEGEWKLIFRHADVSPELIEAFGRLQAA